MEKLSMVNCLCWLRVALLNNKTFMNYVDDMNKHEFELN